MDQSYFRQGLKDGLPIGIGYFAVAFSLGVFAGNVGIHDATWRTEFGGNMYQWDGSHGCINVPYDKAAAIYANIEVGMPVVVYE